MYASTLLDALASFLHTHRIPDLQFNLLIPDRHHPRPELDAYGEIVDVLKPFIGKLKQETRFTDACVTERNRIGLSVSRFSLSVRVSSVRVRARGFASSERRDAPVSPMTMYLNRYAYDMKTVCARASDV
jgi:hypothetical protein